jgi:hypothetical protein
MRLGLSKLRVALAEPHGLHAARSDVTT